ncbi:hypothetical protein AcV5_006863 [Taiwanofungus camphoratus]|nr:hypothetical protein AcV5_006863 [Antrodia cinnamomea]
MTVTVLRRDQAEPRGRAWGVRQRAGDLPSERPHENHVEEQPCSGERDKGDEESRSYRLWRRARARSEGREHSGGTLLHARSCHTQHLRAHPGGLGHWHGLASPPRTDSSGPPELPLLRPPSALSGISASSLVVGGAHSRAGSLASVSASPSPTADSPQRISVAVF